ncbi:hypothetical protein CDL15_Pgr012753 [Punica granatum]|uniref:Uncharacterized protein n=1 Tax=Punica granatum TaxID=22663 RepID=A0A218XG04_PUNGR|nr:hypothetical protein CDL15_Pgr012753 [Punica granatum]PKI48569.1 hypothetical protein CRG98_031051 [Punica granatum]
MDELGCWGDLAGLGSGPNWAFEIRIGPSGMLGRIGPLGRIGRLLDRIGPLLDTVGLLAVGWTAGREPSCWTRTGWAAGRTNGLLGSVPTLALTVRARKHGRFD